MLQEVLLFFNRRTLLKPIKWLKSQEKKKNMKNNQMAPAGGLGYLGVSFCTPEGGGFNPPSEHVQEATDQCFSPSLSPPSPLHSYLHS